MAAQVVTIYPNSTRARSRLAAAVASALLLSGFAHSQDNDSVDRMVATAAARLLDHREPMVRGEAALVVAARRAAEHNPRLLMLAQDAASEARLRATLALGIAGTPGACQVLAPRLRNLGDRSGAEGVVAAYALGMLPEEIAGSTVSTLLASLRQGNWRRQRDVLVALLLALRANPSRSQATVLRQIWDDESLRDGEVRALLLEVLLPLDDLLNGRNGGAEAAAWRRLLERGSDPERAALLRYIAAAPTPVDAALIEPLLRVAAHASDPAQRVAALAALTRMRHLPALDLAAEALDDHAPTVMAQGMRSALAIGGAGMRTVLENHLLHADEAHLAALLPAYDAPPSPELADLCARLATDLQRPLAVRATAAVALARGANDRAAPILRDLFRSARDPAVLPALAGALCAPGTEPPALDRLLDGTGDLTDDPERWQALLGVRHPEAIRLLLRVLDDPLAHPEHLRLALQLWRRATVVAAPHAPVGSVPTALRDLLGDR